MDGLGRAIGAGSSVTLAGKTYLIEPLTLKDIGRIENRIVASREYPLDDLLEMANSLTDTEPVESLIKQAVNDMRKDRVSRIVTVQQFNEWLATTEGVVYTGWLCLRPNHPEFSVLESVLALFAEAGQQEIKDFIRNRDLISGFHLLSVLDWPDSSKSKRRQNDPFADNKYRPIPWRSIFRALAENRFFSKHEIESWTLYEYNIQTMDESSLGGTKRMSAEDAEVVSRKKIVHIGPGGKGLEEWQQYQKVAEERRRQLKETEG